LDKAWNEAYVRRERAPLSEILADDFRGLTPSCTDHERYADDQSSRRDCEVNFVQRTRGARFRKHAISRGRLRLEMDVLHIDQRFLRVFDGT